MWTAHTIDAAQTSPAKRTLRNWTRNWLTFIISLTFDSLAYLLSEFVHASLARRTAIIKKKWFLPMIVVSFKKIPCAILSANVPYVNSTVTWPSNNTGLQHRQQCVKCSYNSQMLSHKMPSRKLRWHCCTKASAKCASFDDMFIMNQSQSTL